MLFSPTFLSFFRRRFWGITIGSITQEVEGVALESLHPAGHLVRRKSHNGGLYRVSRTQPFIVILHRNLAFFQTLCEAVSEIYRQAYRSGHNGTDSKSVELERVPWVRIPPPAPSITTQFLHWVVIFCCRFVKFPYFSYKHLPFIFK